MFKKSWLFLTLLCVLVLQGIAFARENLHFDGFIADEAQILSDDVKYDLNMTLWDLQKKSGADIAVVILKELNGRSVESTAYKIGTEYKIGSKEKNNGVVFLTALKERKMRIELGTGLENKILMSDLENIRDKDILPYYRNGDYENGVSRGTYMLADLVAEAEGVSINHQGTCPERTNGSSSKSREPAPWWCYVIALILAPFSGRRRRSFGSFGGFGGGGGFGGCGCSGSW